MRRNISIILYIAVGLAMAYMVLSAPIISIFAFAVAAISVYATGGKWTKGYDRFKNIMDRVVSGIYDLVVYIQEQIEQRKELANEEKKGTANEQQ